MYLSSLTFQVAILDILLPFLFGCAIIGRSVGCQAEDKSPDAIYHAAAIFSHLTYYVPISPTNVRELRGMCEYKRRQFGVVPGKERYEARMCDVPVALQCVHGSHSERGEGTV